MNTFGSSWRGSKQILLSRVGVGSQGRIALLHTHSKPIPFKYLSSQSIITHSLGKYLLRIYCALGNQGTSTVPSVSLLSSACSPPLHYRFFNQQDFYISEWLLTISNIHLLSLFDFFQFHSFFWITSRSTATGSQEPFRVNGILLEKLWKLKACVSYTNSFPIMLYRISRHTPCHPQTSASSDEIWTDK